MSLADTLAAIPASQPGPRGPRCTIAVLIDTLRATDPEAADALVVAIDGPANATALGDALAEHGHQVGVFPLQRHRRRGRTNGCRCPR